MPVADLVDAPERRDDLLVVRHDDYRSLALTGTGTARADRDMLRRAISNLLANAIRHTPRDGTIRVAISEAPPAQAALSIENPGLPIAPDHLPRLFDRFYRDEGIFRLAFSTWYLSRSLQRTLERSRPSSTSYRRLTSSGQVDRM